MMCIIYCAFCLVNPSAGAETVLTTPPQKTPAAQATLFDRIVELNKVQEPELDAAEMRTEFQRLTALARTALKSAATPKEKIAALNKILLADRKVAYISNKYWRDATLAASLLRGKGNCLSTATLYMLVGSALELPIHMVVIPQHAFARWDDTQARINIETTDGGREIADSEYLSRWSSADPGDIEKLGWGKSLDESGAYVELLRVTAAHRIGENRLEDALALIEQATQLQPERPDLKLWHCEVMANVDGRRDEARLKVHTLLQDQKTHPLPPSVETDALVYLARDAAGNGDHERERFYLMAAYSHAPKSAQMSVLTSLAFCLRALKDFHGAVRYMELVAAMEPLNDSVLYNLAILQKNDNHLPDAIATIQRARSINPESWNLQILEAGYLILNGQREEGQKVYATLEKPRGDVEFWAIMQAWFMAASRNREKFYIEFEHALQTARDTQILEWIDQDPDLDVYRKDEEFKALVEKHRDRLHRSKGL